ncbi:SusC/RagA family TonB-linked outer membrane protein [Sphingobacterium luzhongxinii]|uniref:SusC/RagA family TonB-linked outer membrane protein n=1 Tax=Sphingobacterium luzhongxinii TaxID=2654181 RepID=UPI0013DA3944|nr:TonB-dependent receptor [Sphingobacterium sp. xlx-73]
MIKILNHLAKPAFLWATLGIAIPTHSWAIGINETVVLQSRVSTSSIGQLLNKMEKKFNIKFSYSPDLLKSIALKDTDIEKLSKNELIPFLEKAIAQPVSISKLNEHLYTIAPKDNTPSQIRQQQQQISGTVTNQVGTPIEGVSVTILGKNHSTLTSANGRFLLEGVVLQDKLTFTSLGYERKELTVTSFDDIQIELQSSNVGLDEVVVVGYGNQKKRNVTGSISSISGKDIATFPTSNITNALAGRVNGVFASQRSGAPGSGSDIVIRGKSTTNGTSPLYVIDGIPRTFNDFQALNSEEIETISILKDASSAAVYGARAANGVVLVTTKRGSNQDPVIVYSSFVGKDTYTRVPKRMNAYEHAIYRNRVATFNNLPTTDPSYYTDDEIKYFKDNNTNYDWFEGAWHDPVYTKHDLSVNGGSEKINYFSSIGYYYQDGAFNNLNYNRYNLRSNVDAKIAKNLTASLNLDASLQERSRPYWPYDGGDDDRLYDLYRALLNKPSMMPWKIGDKYVRAYQQWNPIALIDNAGFSKWNRNTFNGLLRIDYNIPGVEGLKVNGTMNYRKYYDYNKTLRKKYDVTEFEMTGGHNHIVTDKPLNSLQLGDWDNSTFASFNQNNSYTMNLSVNYDRTFGKHAVTGLLLYEQSEGTTAYLYGFRNKMLSTSIEQLFIGDAAAANKDATGTETETGRLGYVGRLTYGYNNKYLLEANFRYDASLKFAPEGRWGFFPSVAVGWIMSEESFIKDNWQFVDNLKLRLSHGLLGNDGGDQVSEYGYINRFSTTAGAVFGGATSGILPGALPNYAITWEKTRITNAGLDFSFLRGNLSGSLEYFQKHTYDILGTRIASIPNTFGATLPRENYGVVDNYGIEASLRHDRKIGNDFAYFIGGNFSFARNKVKMWDVSPGAFDYQQRVGRPIDFITGYQANGIARTDADLVGLPTYSGFNYSKGDVILLDQNDDGNITSADMVVLSQKSMNPEIIYGINLGAAWKGLDINAFFQGVANREIMFPNRGDLWDEQAVLSIFNDTWSPETPDATYPRVGGIGASSIGASRQASSFWMLNGNYMRLKNLELGYTLQESLIKRLGIKGLRLYVSGNNLITFDKVDVADPEAISGNYGVYQYPIMKSITGGLSFKF